MPWTKGKRLPLVSERDADDRTREIYQDIKYRLGVPHVSLLFQAYAAYPPFLDMHWTRLRRIVETQEFFCLAERLRADGYTRAYGYLRVPDLSARMEQLPISRAARAEVNELIDLFQYVNPLLLLIASAQLRASESPIGQNAARTLPATHPVFTNRPVLIAEDAASSSVRKVYDDIRRTLAWPFVGSTFRALARWPDFLAAYWEVLKPILQSPIYAECSSGVRETAWALTRELPASFELTLDELAEAGMRDEDAASVVRITEAFVEILSALMLNISVARIGLEGGTAIAAPQRTIASGTPEAAA